MNSPEQAYQFEDIARSYDLAVEKGTVRRGTADPEVQSRLSDLGNLIGIIMRQEGVNSRSLAMSAGVKQDDVIAIRYGVETLQKTRENLPRIALALGIHSEQVDLSILQVVWPEHPRGWLIP